MAYTKQQRYYKTVVKPMLEKLDEVARKEAGYKQKGVRINVKRMSTEQITKLIVDEMLGG